MVQFSSVTEQADRALVVGGGTSLAGFDFSSIRPVIAAGIPVIAVNLAIQHTPATHWFTFHPTMLLSERYNCGAVPVKRYAAVGEGYGTPRAECKKDRTEPPHAVSYLQQRFVPDNARNIDMEWRDPSFVYTGNGGFGAFQVALKMGATKIAMLGIDADPSGHFYAVPNDAAVSDTFSYLRQLFDLVSETHSGVKVMNGSPSSLVSAFPRSTPGAAVDWLLQS